MVLYYVYCEAEGCSDEPISRSHRGDIGMVMRDHIRKKHPEIYEARKELDAQISALQDKKREISPKMSYFRTKREVHISQACINRHHDKCSDKDCTCECHTDTGGKEDGD